jgi:hypothetical protein
MEVPLHFVFFELNKHSFKDALHELSLHKIGLFFGHFIKEGQSSKLLLQSPLGHLIGINLGQIIYLGH